MTTAVLSDITTYLEPLLCIAVLGLVWKRGLQRDYRFVVAYLFTRLFMFGIYISLHNVARGGQYRFAYDTYFYFYWLAYAVEAVLGFGIIWSIYNLAMAPLKGLQRLGRLMFRWAAGIASAVALAMAFGPHMTGLSFMTRFISQLQQTQSVLTLCMLLFVVLTIHPMGLSQKSKIFGVSLGLGVLATAQLVFSAWLSQVASMRSIFNMLEGAVTCASLLIWMGYFAMPEPKRRMIILPTTSPFLRWNQISMALGDEPGYVALGTVTEDMFAPAEVEIMRRASAKMAAPVYIN